MGSLIRGESLADDKRLMLLNVFKQIPQRILWKWEGNFPEKPSNVMIREWMPQRDILGGCTYLILHVSSISLMIIHQKPAISSELNLIIIITIAEVFVWGGGGLLLFFCVIFIFITLNVIDLICVQLILTLSCLYLTADCWVLPKPYTRAYRFWQCQCLAIKWLTSTLLWIKESRKRWILIV